ncbi:MAG: MazG nucleotide pyrophosphohydrolase domain-containing protein [Desulfuromonadaceae bacterium]|nr:MazG nucleotide pyrophosphohydrolase domain-containing protein [Desulfuromonadaceae bacterium]
MDIRDILQKQADFDSAHGWDTTIIPEKERLHALERELVGLMGEVGEVANLVKKARLVAERIKPVSDAYLDIVPSVNEELIDVLIYLLRMFQITGADIDAEYLRKLDFNKDRFKKYENTPS